MLSLIPMYILTTVKNHRLVMSMHVNEIHTKELTKGKSNGTKIWQKCEKMFLVFSLIYCKDVRYNIVLVTHNK